MHGQDGHKEGKDMRETSCSGARLLGKTTEDRDLGQISQRSDARIGISAFVGNQGSWELESSSCRHGHHHGGLYDLLRVTLGASKFGSTHDVRTLVCWNRRFMSSDADRHSVARVPIQPSGGSVGNARHSSCDSLSVSEISFATPRSHPFDGCQSNSSVVLKRKDRACE